MDRSTYKHALAYIDDAEAVSVDCGIESMEALRQVTRKVKIPCRAAGVAFAVLYESHGVFSVARDILEKRINDVEGEENDRGY